MDDKKFFMYQNELTEAKIQIYKQYLTVYLPKLLLTFKNLFIADLFCGPGKHSGKDGSPLILIERIKYILTSQQINRFKNLKINILFNDHCKNNIENLKETLSNYEYDNKLINVKISEDEYENIFNNIIYKMKSQKIPKFFFLDPFSYSDVKIDDLKKLIKLPKSEILLFIPIFHSYRFSSNEFKENHKTRIFIEEYTTKGITNYFSVHDFMNDIKQKLCSELKTESNIPYIRPVLLEDGSRKNSLFLITMHQKGMLEMNKIVLKKADDGNSIKVKDINQMPLFSTVERSSVLSKLKEIVIKKIKKENITNEDLVDFIIRAGYLPKNLKKILKDLYNKKKVAIFTDDCLKNEIKNTNQWNIAEKITKIRYIKWIGND